MNHLTKRLKEYIQEKNKCFIDENNPDEILLDEKELQCLYRKADQLKNRESNIVRSIVDGRIVSTKRFDNYSDFEYFVHYQHLVRSKQKFFLEEHIQRRKARFIDNELVSDEEMTVDEGEQPPVLERETEAEVTLVRFNYDRREAVRYAERWWNDYNPRYKKFENNCTNFISQCLHAGGAPMTGYPNRSKGWWYQNNNWSYSWSVAHAMRWYLSGAKSGLRGQEMGSAKDLSLGDVICYDFNGDGRFQHTTIVVAKDENGMPLVNAQTTNSRMRYWAYEDSTAWTPNIKYKFFHIVGS